MNPTSISLNLIATGSGKKLIAVVLSSMAIVISLPFMAVISLGSEPLQFLASVPDAMAAETQGFYMGGAVAGNTYEWGNCTYWVFAQRLWAGRPIPVTWGNANTWDDYSKRDGYEVNHTPLVTSIFQTDAGKWGHVAYVIKVDANNGDWTISEMNAPGVNMVRTRTFSKESATAYNFIHGKKGEAAWTPLPNLPQQLFMAQ